MFNFNKPLFTRPLKILLITNSLILVAGAMIGPIYALFVEEIGGDLLAASISGSAFTLSAGITTLIAGKISDKLQEKKSIIFFGYLLMGLGFLLYTVCFSLWFLLLIQILIGFGEAIYSPAFNAIYSKHLDKNKAGQQWGAWESLNYFSLAIGSGLGGIIASVFGFGILFLIMAGLSFLSALYVYFLPKKIL